MKSMDFTKISDHILIGFFGIGGLQLLHDVAFQEWTKIGLQAAVAFVTIFTLVKKSKKGFRKDVD
jgi:hypothetical protein